MYCCGQQLCTPCKSIALMMFTDTRNCWRPRSTKIPRIPGSPCFSFHQWIRPLFHRRSCVVCGLSLPRCAAGALALPGLLLLLLPLGSTNMGRAMTAGSAGLAAKRARLRTTSYNQFPSDFHQKKLFLSLDYTTHTDYLMESIHTCADAYCFCLHIAYAYIQMSMYMCASFDRAHRLNKCVRVRVYLRTFPRPSSSHTPTERKTIGGWQWQPLGAGLGRPTDEGGWPSIALEGRVQHPRHINTPGRTALIWLHDVRPYEALVSCRVDSQYSMLLVLLSS